MTNSIRAILYAAALCICTAVVPGSHVLVAQSESSPADAKAGLQRRILEAEERRRQFIERSAKSEKPGIAQGDEPPRVDPPPVTVRRKLDYAPGALPKDAKARYPSYDGGRFHVTFPVKQQDEVGSKEVMQDVVIPVLKALGFTRDPDRSYQLPPEKGVPQKRADLGVLADMVETDYAENPELLRPKTRRMLAVLKRDVPPDDEMNKAFLKGGGMTFPQYVAGIERLEIQYPFQQVENGIPIEHVLVVAMRWEGQGISSVWGNFLNDYKVVNDRKLDGNQIIANMGEALAKVGAIKKLARSGDLKKIRVLDGPYLIYLPYGTDAQGVHRLRLSYRLIFETQFAGEPRFKFLTWTDAETGEILKLESLTKNAEASATVYKRDPGIGTKTQKFKVDPAVGGTYVLSLSGMSSRVDFEDDGYNADDVSISSTMDGSNANFANFNQSPLNDASEALCASGSNSIAFQQVNLFSKIYRYRRWGLGHAVFTPFPSAAWDIRVGEEYCNANASMRFGICEGWADPMCPARTPGFTNSSGLNTALDDTWIAHEMGHNLSLRYTNERPGNWCLAAVCVIPLGWGKLHDLADFWGDHFTSTNCFGGWNNKNSPTTDASLYCTGGHSADGGTPRLHELFVPFIPGEGTIGDHYPEHRDIDHVAYSDGQIGTAALWQVRLGMRSKCRPSGLPQFGVRFARALKRTGFFLPTSDNEQNISDDRLVYEYLTDLETMMVDEWATAGSPGGAPAFKHNGSHTANKVTAGFAKAGFFLVPDQCIDGNTGTADPAVCPDGEDGADAVIDIDDNDIADDKNVNGVDHPEVDFLELGGPSPTFHVWTGSRFTFDADGDAVLNNPAPCNSQFRVQVSTEDDFPPPSTVQSGWITVDRDPTTPDPPECYGTWSPSAAEWTGLQDAGAGTRLYYRATTRTPGPAVGDVRLSTEPRNGAWTLPPPYAVLTENGRSDY